MCSWHRQAFVGYVQPSVDRTTSPLHGPNWRTLRRKTESAQAAEHFAGSLQKPSLFSLKANYSRVLQPDDTPKIVATRMPAMAMRSVLTIPTQRARPPVSGSVSIPDERSIPGLTDKVIVGRHVRGSQVVSCLVRKKPESSKGQKKRHDLDDPLDHRDVPVKGRTFMMN